MSKENEKVSVTISDGEGNARAHFDSLEEFDEAGKKIVNALKANNGVIGEAPDYSDYKEYWTIPKKVHANSHSLVYFKICYITLVVSAKPIHYIV